MHFTTRYWCWRAVEAATPTFYSRSIYREGLTPMTEGLLPTDSRPELVQLTDQLLLTTAEAAKALHLSRSTVYTLITQGVLRPVHIGRCCRISRRELQRYVDRLDAPATDAVASPSAMAATGRRDGALDRPVSPDAWDGDSAA